MNMNLRNEELVTSSVLLNKIKNVDDQPAWDRFYAFYCPLIIGFCKQKGCTDDMAFDVLQESMVTLIRVMPKFDYNPDRGNFRSYLLKIVERRLLDTVKRNRLLQNASPTAKTEFFNQLEDPGAKDFRSEWDQLWDQNLITFALERVKEKINRVTFCSFQMYALENKQAEVVAKMLNLNKNTVFQHKNRVIRLLKQEVEKLKQDLGE